MFTRDEEGTFSIRFTSQAKILITKRNSGFGANVCIVFNGFLFLFSHRPWGENFHRSVSSPGCRSRRRHIQTSTIYQNDLKKWPNILFKCGKRDARSSYSLKVAMLYSFENTHRVNAQHWAEITVQRERSAVILNFQTLYSENTSLPLESESIFSSGFCT